MKSSFYLKHDLDARDDDKMRALIMKLGARGYGIYWWIAEDLYRSSGKMARDYAALAWAYHEPEKDVKSVVENFDLFYDSNGKIACRRVDRAISERKDASEQARAAGKASAAKRALSACSTTVKPGEERTGEVRLGEDKTAAPSAADLKEKISTTVDNLVITPGQDLEDVRLPFQHGDVPKGRRIMDMSADDCKSVIAKHPRLGFQIERALRHRLKIKSDENHSKLRAA